MAATGRYTTAAAQTSAGLQKWMYHSTAQTWKLAYTLSSGLNLGQPYTVAGYPVGDNAATGLPWAPATDGLRNLTGRANRDGTVTLDAITSTVSGSGDQGADPNQLVSITDRPSGGARAAGEQFSTVIAPRYGEVLRGGLADGRRRCRTGGRPAPRASPAVKRHRFAERAAASCALRP